MASVLSPCAFAQDAAPTTTVATVHVARIAVEGVGEHPSSGIGRAAIDAVANQALRDISPTLPAALNFEQIKQITARITQAYRDAGFLVSVAYVPPQQIDDSQTLTLKVMEGRVGRVLVQGSRRYRDDQLGASSLGLIGRPLRQTELERALLYARDLPGVSVTSVLQPGQNEGETDIILVARDSDRPYEITAGMSNHGTDSTGRYRAELGVSAFNALGMGDVLAASVGYGLDPADSWQAALSLSAPLAKVDGLSAIAGVSRSEIELNSGPFAAIGIKGPTTLYYAGSDWKFIQRPDLQVQASMRWVHEESRLEGLDIELSRHTFDVIDAGVSLRHTDRRWRGMNLAQLSVRKSINDDSPPFNWLYAAHESYFWVGRLSLARLQALPGNQRLLLRGSAQFTDDALTPVEQFSIGGPTSVRAYPLSTALGDRGVQATFEYQVSAPGFADTPSPFNGRRWGDLVELNLFYDWGRTSPAPDNRRIGFQPTTLEGAGVAIGLRLPWKPDLRLDVCGARPAGSHRAADGRSTQYWARISTTF
ncbi:MULTISPECIES: ShlB/FhaC/HecB family hemolysin secretion/activation protein [Stenotrophomonas]|uniref:ShlB/FhaC/HecB family hemolysin secretion/activation protein n=1 Tax=Stenotrophomonas TaxID=40323 RepID=UPI001CF5991E|nr:MULTISPECIES: ShlB/FhaC/HecB family hemolysin secretion/activation protein [Stenotrophomonas]MCA7025159.1 ShlB/FhaC/HecB family hemolysin secretion/activation protein [Stenotrophomonas acidaminiphila]MCE4075534.1 ShlB/FhaC/HecB family hemolysin secretion/activation protein [Stenotrophomonas acidaminiphila]